MLQQVFSFHLCFTSICLWLYYVYIPEYVPYWNSQWSFKKELGNITYLLCVYSLSSTSCLPVEFWISSSIQHLRAFSPWNKPKERYGRKRIQISGPLKNSHQQCPAGMCINLLVIRNTLNIQTTAEILRILVLKERKHRSDGINLRRQSR